MILETVISALLVIGSFFMVVGAFGLARLPDFFSRLHGPTKATTLGVGSFLVAAIIYFPSIGEGLPLGHLLIAAFLFLTAPVSAHLLARAGMSEKLPGRQEDGGASPS